MIPIRQTAEQKPVQTPRQSELAADLVSLERLKALLAELELQLRADGHGSEDK